MRAVFLRSRRPGGGYARTPGLFYKSQQSPRIPIKVPHTAEMGKYREYMERPKPTFKKKRYEHCREAFQFNTGVSDVVLRKAYQSYS